MLSMDVTLQRGRFDLSARLHFNAGVTGLFGPSGSGKSTLLGMIAGLVRPDRGRIEFAGEPLYDSDAGLVVPPHRRRIGLVFQDSQLFPHCSVEGNLLYGLKRTPKGDRRFRLNDIVELLGLGPLLAAHPRHISGGEKQRVALGRALLASPRLLLLDEPLASLDNGHKEQILPFLVRIRDELAMPMIYVSHALPEVLRLTDNLALIKEGRMLAQGKLDQLLQRPLGEPRNTLGWENLLAVTVEAQDIEGGCTVARFQHHRLALPLRAWLEPGRIEYVAVHKSEIALSREVVAGISIQNQVPGTIVRVDAHGTGVQVTVDVGVPLCAEISPRAWRDLQLREKEKVYCLIKTRSFVYLSEPPEGLFHAEMILGKGLDDVDVTAAS